MLRKGVRQALGRFFALISLFMLGSCCDKDQIPQLTNKLYDESARVRNQAALDLASCGSSASAAVPRLIQLLYEPNVGVQSAAAFALTKIDTKEARPAMAEAKSKKRGFN